MCCYRRLSGNGDTFGVGHSSGRATKMLQFERIETYLKTTAPEILAISHKKLQ